MGPTYRPSISSRPGPHVRGRLPRAGHARRGRQLPPMPLATLSLPGSKHSRRAPPSRPHSPDSFPAVTAPSLRGPSATRPTTSTVSTSSRQATAAGTHELSGVPLPCLVKPACHRSNTRCHRRLVTTTRSDGSEACCHHTNALTCFVAGALASCSGHRPAQPRPPDMARGTGSSTPRDRPPSTHKLRRS
jgi:hypothetical protein